MSKSQELAPFIKEVQDAAAAIKGDEVGLAERDRLTEATRRLAIASDTPHEYLQNVRNQVIQNVCIMMGIQMGLFEAIASNAGKPITTAELSTKTKYSQSLVWRIMRLMTPIGIGEEVGPATYKANPILEALTTPPQVSGIHCIDGLMFPIGAKILEYMRTQEFKEFPKDGEKGISEFAYGMPLWEAMRLDPTAKETYDTFMAGRRAIVKDHWYDAFPVEQKLQGSRSGKGDVLLVDIAGNTGHDIKSFRDKYPNYPGRLILQDLNETLSIIKDPLEGIEKMQYDFYTPQPIKGARLYYMRNIVHDWSDDHCQKFLSNQAEAMDKDYSTLLLDDWVLDETDTSLLAATEDIMMMLVANGKERTLEEWKNLLASAGLEIVKVWRSPENRHAVVEAKKN